MSYYDKEGKPIDLFRFAELFQDLEYRRIGHTELEGGISVSTVWLGLDHSFF